MIDTNQTKVTIFENVVYDSYFLKKYGWCHCTNISTDPLSFGTTKKCIPYFQLLKNEILTNYMGEKVIWINGKVDEPFIEWL